MAKTVAPPTQPPLAWDQSMDARSFFQTWFRVCIKPTKAFASPILGDWRRHLYFAIFVNLSWVLGFVALNLYRAQSGSNDAMSLFEMAKGVGMGFLMQMITLVYQAGLMNVLLRFIERKMFGFQIAFRAACYAQAPAALILLGNGGMLIFFFWNVIIMIPAIALGYKVSFGKSIALNVIYVILAIFLQMIFN